MKRCWKILIFTIAALAVVLLVAVVRHYQLRAAMNAYIAQLKAQGEPMDLAQVLPPPVPPEQNSADTFRRAAALMNPYEGWWITNAAGGMRMVAPGKAMVCSQQPNIRGDTFTDSWQDAEAAIYKDKQALALLRQIIGKPDFDFQINYDAGAADLSYTNLYLPQAKLAAQRLSAAAIYDLHNGDATSAIENMQALLAIIQALREERFAISELVRMAIAQMAASANWELLQATNLTDGQLAELQTNWTNLDFIQSEPDVLAMERAIGLIMTAKWRGSNADMEHSFAIDPKVREAVGLKPLTIWDKVKFKYKIFMWQYWWSYPDEVRSLKGYQVLIGTMRADQTNSSFQETLENQTRKLNELRITKLGDTFSDPNFHAILSQSINVLSGIARRVMIAEVTKRTVITAIALKRYQLKHGNYPPDLDALVPEFLAAVPRDPVDGKPLRYRPNADGTFLLYSVGENGKDDGGNPALEKGVEGANLYWLNPRALDWVWPQPATPEEIEKFYKHPPE